MPGPANQRLLLACLPTLLGALLLQVLSQVQRFSAAVGGRTRVLLVPSPRDAHLLPVFPQPAVTGEGGGDGDDGDAVMPLPNPATLRCNEVVLGCTSVDWLMACNREEVVGRGAAAATAQQQQQHEDRLPALASHLATQRCYFPLFPPPLDLPLDTSKAVAALVMPACTPDLLLLPSELAPFAKTLTLPPPPCPAASDEASEQQQQPSSIAAAAAAAAAAEPPGVVVCVNPGRLTKGSSGGTFAHIHILPLPEAVGVAAGAPAATNAPVPHRVDQRCRVEIRRI